MTGDTEKDQNHAYRELVRLVKSLEHPPGVDAFASLSFRDMTKVYFKVMFLKISKRLRQFFRKKR